ncbi:hypothetical protein LEP1GSC188_3430 [Leptospira weilii serovar Topaz str. LT2116]|uniref:Uncharacterized protein n=1 Tax=Leptospira weilii serovar Topaz str. LT2116 TaxID=1088540 RepID=M3G586_9LEPT|nr:hypothetical protein LEP1GSC188_3430 [Leptospira weilii serovar Topaz str. LT2116]
MKKLTERKSEAQRGEYHSKKVCRHAFSGTKSRLMFMEMYRFEFFDSKHG